MLVTYTLVKIVPNLVSYVVESDFEDNSRGENRDEAAAAGMAVVRWRECLTVDGKAKITAYKLLHHDQHLSSEVEASFPLAVFLSTVFKDTAGEDLVLTNLDCEKSTNPWTLPDDPNERQRIGAAMMPAAHANVQKISDVLETEMILGLHREKKKVGSYAGHATLDKDGNQDIKCVTICVQNAFHRVGVAAYSQAPASMLEHGQRPKPFIGSSRQL
ncbi:hypothetical protein VTP01DRAFT_6856 [Rhizomucor pusillus]|uniref:uncharacterized protein n=1 Tax=Rhizomucor pusillus TaxID=4840 RepID=UPI003743DB79